MSRPPLTKQTNPADFLSFYWLKEELVAFLREHQLPTTGSKQELTSRISQFLTTGSVLATAKPSPKSAKVEMPPTFTRQSIIGTGWRCSQELRAFFEQEIGKHFHFDGIMRDLIHNGSGKTLEEAIEIWQEESRKPRKEKPIAAQFEYNRHMREYFKTHPQATLQEAIQDWETKKAQRRH